MSEDDLLCPEREQLWPLYGDLYNEVVYIDHQVLILEIVFPALTFQAPVQVLKSHLLRHEVLKKLIFFHQRKLTFNINSKYF